jgi:hypothetical protein
MAQDNQKPTKRNKKAHDLQDVEPGSDADEIPVPKVGETPRVPNGTSDASKVE